MAGKRLLDAAALFNASCSVLSKHVVLRRHQLDVYTKTSSLFRYLLGRRYYHSTRRNGDNDFVTTTTTITTTTSLKPPTTTMTQKHDSHSSVFQQSHATISRHHHRLGVYTKTSLILLRYMSPLRYYSSHRTHPIADDKNNNDKLVSKTTADLKPTTTTIHQKHESTVPSSRLSRLWHYGGLATGMAFGAMSEGLRRATGVGDNNSNESSGGSSSLMMSAGNMDRLVSKLSTMRGAALKLGQMMSFQDSKMLPAPIVEVLQRVQDSADYMPAWQRDQVLSNNLGSNWRSLFSTFEEIPMAAASIGQVHGAVLKSTGQAVAVKVQYPGVASSIDSDLDNLSILLTASRLLPKGLYLEKTIANARKELSWECDYVREAECAKKFKALLKDDDAFVVPAIIDEASSKQVLTMERMSGVGVTKLDQRLSRKEKDWIGTQILRLCLREMVEFGFMQTDPNWTNFLYSDDDDDDGRRHPKIQLLDFGASRSYPQQFMDDYIDLLEAASLNDRERCLHLSKKLGYLTGYESSSMRNAHLDSVLVLAEPFRRRSSSTSSTTTTTTTKQTEEEEVGKQGDEDNKDGEDEGYKYDFSNQTITSRIKSLIPIMLNQRLIPPPEETYSLHRKLSGAFLLCARLGCRVDCRGLFLDALDRRKKLKGLPPYV